MKTVHSANRRGLPFAGVLAFTGGCVMLFSYWKFELYSREWAPSAVLLYLGASFVLTLLGSYRIFTFLRPSSAKAAPPKLFRNRLMMPTLPRPGMVYLTIMCVLFTGSLLGRSNMLMLVFAMMAGPFVLNGWISYTMLRRISVERRVPARAMAGEVQSVSVTLSNRNRSISSWLMQVTDHVRNQFEQLQPVVVFTRVPPRGERTTHYQLRLMQRGRYALGPIQVATRFPLGLIERGRMFDRPAEILVYPQIGRLASSWKREQLVAAEPVQRQEPQRGVFDDEFHCLREYRTGDNPRDIHWPTSARHNELMVCEYRQSREQDLAVLLDLWLPADPGDEDFARIELAVSLAATICVEQMRSCRDADLYVACAGDAVTEWEGQTGPSNLDSLLDKMAVLKAGQQPAVDELLRRFSNRRLTGTRSMLVTTRKRISEISAALETMQVRRSAGAALGDLQLIRAEPEALAAFFEIE